jgi:hypothetical protein
MKLKYNILWLDDKIDDFISDDWIEKVKTHLINNGFEPNVIPISKSEDFTTYLSDDVDLILTDYNLVENDSIGKNGDLIIESIRESSISTEILFYSARAELKIGQINRITFLETRKSPGNHHQLVYNELIKLIDLTIKKFQHIIAMRGMIMHETSSLDEIKLNIINSCIECSDLDGDSISETIFHSVEAFLSHKCNDFKKYKEQEKVKKLMKDTVLFSADHQIVAIQAILSQLEMSDFSDEYSAEINPIRNKFAHAVLKTDEQGIEYFEYGGSDESRIIFDSNKCREIRKNIRKHKENLDNVKVKIDKLS